jgi:hypothetical protein
MPVQSLTGPVSRISMVPEGNPMSKRSILLCFALFALTLNATGEVLLSLGIGQMNQWTKFSNYYYNNAYMDMDQRLEGVAFTMDAYMPFKSADFGLYGILRLGSGDSIENKLTAYGSNWQDKDRGFILDANIGMAWTFLRGPKWYGFAGAGLSAQYTDIEYMAYDSYYTALSISHEQFLCGISETIQIYYFFTPRFGLMAGADYSLLFLPLQFKVTNNVANEVTEKNFKSSRSLSLRLGTSLKL